MTIGRCTHTALDLAAILFYCTAIFVLSSRSLVGEPFYPFQGVDKVAHIGLYGGLGMLICRFLANDLHRSASVAIIGAALLASLYGLSDEIHQLYVPGRRATIGDFVADTIGAVLAVAVWHFVFRRRQKPMAEAERPRQERAAALQSEAPAKKVGR